MDIDKLIEEIGKLEGEKLKKFQEALKKTNIDVKSQAEQVDLLTKAYNALGESTADAEKAQKRFKDSQIDMANINLQVAKATNDYVKEVEAGAEMFELFQKIEEDAAEQRRLGNDVTETTQELLRRLEEQYGMTAEEAAKYYKESKKLTKAFKEGAEAGEDFATNLGLATGILSRKAMGMHKGFVEFAELARSPNGIQGVAKGMQKVINPTNLALGALGLIVEQTLKYAMAVDTATAAFAKQTGAGRALTAEIMAVGGQFRNLGLGAEDAGKAAGTLFDNFTGFMQISRAGRQDLMQTVASLEKLGVSGDTAANALQIMSNNFGMSTKQASKMTKQLSIAGSKIGISASKMMNGFVEASKSLAVYGKDSIKVFTDLAAQAKAAGVEANTLLGIAKQFDTFSGAADAAGKLNSILGAQMSATELLTMKENERIETLIRSVQAQGMAFSDMDKYSQMAVANAAGISDMAEAQRIFGMNVNQYRQGLKNAEAEEEFNKRLKDAMTVMEKIAKVAQNFAIQIAPLVNFLADIAQGILDWSQSMNGLPAMLLAAGAALFLVVKLFPLFAGLIGGMTAALPAFLPVLGSLALGIGAVFTAIAVGSAMMNTEALTALGNILSGLFGGGGGEVNMTARVNTIGEAVDFADGLADREATLKPMLGDLALIATGKTTQSVTTSAVDYSLNTFAAKFENTFKPNVTVKIGNEEFKDFVIEAQEKGSMMS
jgi:hypothetical protein